MPVYDVSGTVEYRVSCTIEADTQEKAEKYFFDYAAIEEVNNGNGSEDIDLDYSYELSDGEAEYSAG